jgi:hypothetical protein
MNSCVNCKHYELALKPDTELKRGQLTNINLVNTPRCKRGYTKKLIVSGVTDCKSFKHKEG